VIVVGFPESFSGRTTQAFAEAVKQDSGFGPHAAFFKAALEKLLGKNQPVELWGLSTGAPIISMILKDPAYQERVNQAVLVCPASSVDQSVASLNLGAMHDLGAMKERGQSAYFTMTVESKIPREKEQIKLREEIFGALITKVAKKNEAWKEARVQDGGNIVVVSGRKDKITKSAERNQDFQQHPQVRVLDLPNGYHMSPQVDAERVIPAIFELQQSAN